MGAWGWGYRLVLVTVLTNNAGPEECPQGEPARYTPSTSVDNQVKNRGKQVLYPRTRG